MATIVILNGTSSAGKTTIARAFQLRAPAPFLNFSIDSILYALPEPILKKMVTGGEVTEINYRDLVRGYYACVKQLAHGGLALITDNAVITRWQSELLLEAVSGHDVLLVSVECCVESAETREAGRGDRRVGLARAQHPNIHRWLEYDLRVNTDTTTAEEAADAIVEALARSERNALERTREKLARTPA